MAKIQKHTKYQQAKQRARKRTKLALVPHKANQYRPHLVRRWGLLAVLALLFGMQATYNYSHSGSVLGETSNLSTERLLLATNDLRAENGLPPLQPSSSLENAAHRKAHDMINRQYWAHTAPDGTESWSFIDQEGYKYAAAGENLARNFSSSEATVAAWMASPEHRTNLLDDGYEDVGFAVVRGMLEGRDSSVVVALYGDPVSEGVVAGVSTPAKTVASIGSLSPMARFGVAVQSLTPAAIGSLVVMLVLTVVALAAHANRHRLPKALQKGWYRHHGLIKSGGLACMALVMVVLYSGGAGGSL